MNRWDVVRKIDELSPATREGVAQSLGADVAPERVDGAFEGAVRHGLIEKSSTDSGDGTAEWKLSDKGSRKLATKESR